MQAYLLALEAELANYTDAHCLAEAGSVLLTCLKNRFGLQQQLEDF